MSSDDIKKAKALQKEYIKARVAKQTTDDMLTWLLKRKQQPSLKGFAGADLPLWQAGVAALLMFGLPVVALVYFSFKKETPRL